MKYIVFYHSTKHKNTEKLLIKTKDILKDISLDLIFIDKNNIEDLSKKNFKDYDRVIFASGIFAWRMHKILFNFLEKLNKNLLPNEVVVVSTSGKKNENLSNSFIKEVSKKFTFIDKFNCLGFDTFGPLALIGGIAKNHPDDEDVKNFISFLEKISK